VRVFLPDLDRGRADPRNIILTIEDNGQYYKLANKYGALPQLYTRNQFSVCLVSLVPLNEVVHGTCRKIFEGNSESNIRRW